MPYEVHFYSSGAIEEGWTEENLKENRLNAIVGYGLGGILACALVVVSGYLFHPLGVDPDDLGTVALPAQGAFGETGLLLALGGMLFCVGGAAIDSSFAASYNLAQFLGWEWGRYQGPQQGAALHRLLAGLPPARRSRSPLSGINPVEITEYCVVLAVVALPLTYLPILLIAGDRSFMGEHANGRIATTARLALLRGDRRPRARRDPAAAGDQRGRRMRSEGDDLRRPPAARRADLDSEGRRCRPRRRHRAAAAARRGSRRCWSGEGLYPRRLPARLRGAARRLAGPERWGANALRIPWEEVDEIDSTVHLRSKAEELGLGAGRRSRERWMVRRLPWN